MMPVPGGALIVFYIKCNIILKEWVREEWATDMFLS